MMQVVSQILATLTVVPQVALKAGPLVMEAERLVGVHQVIVTAETIMVTVVMHMEMIILAILTAVPQVKMVDQMIR